MTIIQDIHTAAWDFRRKYSQWWATPDPDDCLRYAFTEAGELMDAWLRSKRPDDARNNDRQRDVAKELADIAIMLVSAMPELSEVVEWMEAEGEAKILFPEFSIDDVCEMISNCLNITCYEQVLCNALFCVVIYAEDNHIDLLAQVIANLEAINRKHVPESQWTQ